MEWTEPSNPSNRNSTIVKTKITSIVLKVHITWTSWAVAKVNTYNVMIQMSSCPMKLQVVFLWWMLQKCTKLPRSLQTSEFNFIKTHCQHAEIGKEDTRNIAYAFIYVYLHIYTCRMSPIEITTEVWPLVFVIHLNLKLLSQHIAIVESLRCSAPRHTSWGRHWCTCCLRPRQQRRRHWRLVLAFLAAGNFKPSSYIFYQIYSIQLMTQSFYTTGRWPHHANHSPF